MRVLNPCVDWNAFLERIPAARERVLMLDYDGTLAPFQVRPERAVPYPGVAGALDGIMQDESTRVVIVSGRRAADLIALLPLKKQPEIWGGHGWERLLPDGALAVREPADEVRRTLRQASDFARELARDGGRLECKPASVALHWRGLPALAVAKIREQALSTWSPLVRGNDVELLSFDGGIELRAHGCSKQHAVKAILSETAGDGAVAYLGDDITDEDAFAAVKARGIAVLVRPQYRDTRADIWIRPPRELLAFIRRWQARGQRT
ncbi:MAG: trehalose-phosphatase [Burkholderiales bacterium]|nr:trehalose-phosphatase [Burkholderiales bacterium]